MLRFETELSKYEMSQWIVHLYVKIYFVRECQRDILGLHSADYRKVTILELVPRKNKCQKAALERQIVTTCQYVRKRG